MPSRSPATTRKKGDITRKRLLTAAIRLYARHGYEGVSLDEIVAAAKINKRMVYHYFGDKDGLYAAVLKSVFDRLTVLELGVFETYDNPLDVVRGILELYFDFLGENPEFVALLAWENLHQGRFIAKYPELLSKTPFAAKLEQTLREGVQSGIFRKGLNVKYLLIALISPCFVFHANRYTLSQSVGIDLTSPIVLKEGLRHIITLILNGLVARHD